MDKELAFNISITGVSNEASELAKLEIQLRNIKKERDELIKQASKPGHIHSNEERLKLAAYNSEIKRLGDEHKNLKRIVDTAGDSLERMRAKLVEMKRDANAGSAEFREKMSPAIKKLSDDISKAEQAQGTWSRNVGNYASSVADGFISMAKSMVAPAAALAALKKIYEGLKEAIMSTTFAINIMNNVNAASKQIFYDLAINGQININNLKNAIEVQRELNALRVEEGFSNLKVSQINREEMAVREQAIDRTRTHAERLADLNKVTELEHEKTLEKVGSLNRELAAKQKLLDQNKEDEKLMREVLDLKTKINDTYAQEDQALKWIQMQRTGFIQEQEDNWKAYMEEIEETNKKADKAAQDARDKEEDEIKKNHKAIRDLYKKKWEDLVNEEIKGNKLMSEVRKLMGVSDDYNKLQQNKELADQQKEQIDKINDDRLKSNKETEDKILSYKLAALQGAQLGADAAFDAKKNRLQAEMEAELSNQNLTDAQKLAIQKKYAKEQQRMAVNQALINGALAIGKIFAEITPLNPLSWVAVAMAAVQTAIQVAVIKSQKFAHGGYTKSGSKYEPAGVVHAGEWVAPQEIVKNPVTGPVISALERSRLAMMGSGSGVLRNTTAYGYANGGYVGQIAPTVLGSGIDYDRLAKAISETMIPRIHVINDLNKVRSGLNELEMINEAQKI